MSVSITKRKKNGRPLSFRTSYVKQAYRLALLGATNEQLARAFDVAVSTITVWMDSEPKFSASVKKGRDEADAKVADSLYRRATGYSHPDVVITNHKGTITATKVTKHYPPDTTAAIFWLKNRQREKWRDVQRHEVTGKDGAPLEAAAANPMQLRDELLRRGAVLPGPIAIPILHRS